MRFLYRAVIVALFAGCMFSTTLVGFPAPPNSDRTTNSGISGQTATGPKTEQSSFWAPDPNQLYSYNLSETSQRNYAWSPFSTGNITIDTPASYNTSTANVYLRVMNTTLNESTVVDHDPNGLNSRAEQVQGFTLVMDANLTGFSIFVPTFQPASQVLMKLLNSTAGVPDSTKVITSFTVPSFLGGNLWLNYTFLNPVFMLAGHYYLYMNSTTPFQNAWGKTADGIKGDAYVNDSGTWDQQTWNLTLKLWKYDALTPSSVGMNVSGQPVQDSGPGQGWANVSQNFTDSPISFQVVNNTPVTYAADANMSLRVWNATLNESTVVNFDPTQFASRYEQAQGFTTGMDANLSGFSIFVPTSQPTSQIWMAIRNNTYNGQNISSFVVNYAGGNYWLNVTFPTSIFLPKGHYYLYMAAASPSNNAWGHSDSGIPGDAWANNGGWSLQPWNLSLQLQKYDVVNPSAVGLSITGQAVTDLGNGQGWANVSQNFTQSPIQFSVTNSTPNNYNAFANLSMQVMNSTLNDSTIINVDGTGSSKNQQTQGFYTYVDANLSGFSIYVISNNQKPTVTLEILNNSYSTGNIIWSNNSIPLSNTVNAWLNVSFPQSIFLPKGHYYLLMTAVTGNPNQWAHTTTSTTGDTFVYSGSWSPAGWDLTLKLRKYDVVDPTAVGMTVSGLPVANLGNGRGWVNVSQNFTSPTISFAVTNSTPITYQVTANVTFRVWNTTLNTSTFINFDPSQFGSRYEQTQGFTMGSDAYLAGFSIFVPTSQPTSQIGMELRNTTYNGPTIAGSAVVVNYIGGNAWLNVTFPTSIFMLKGQYYLYMDASGPTYNAWGQTTTGVPGDAWIYNQTTSNWERQNWNLTLQLDKFDVVDPIVGMSVLGQPVANLGNGWGWVNVSQNFTSSPIMFPVSNSTPIFYSVFANLTIHVMSATVNETTLIDYSTDASSSRFEQAQGFFMSTDSFLSGLSIFVPTTNTATQITMEIRNSTYAGQSVYSFPVNYAGVNDWLNLTFYPTLYLPQGHYYLYMPLSSPSANAWGRTVSGGTGDTWANNGSWGLQGWNLTLKLDAYNSVNPSSVFMNLTGQGITQAVSDLGNGYGWANVTQSITGPTQELDIVNSTPVLYSYQVNASYFASMPLATSVSLDQNPPNWTVSIPYTNSSFVNYQANITGFQSDYFNIQVLNGSTVVGYTWVNATTIQIASPIDHVTFQSLNYIACITCPAEVYLGSTVTVSACLLGYGNVNLTIQQGTNVLYQSIVAATYEAFFSWPIGTATPAGPVTIQAYLTGINEIGFNASATIIKTEAALLVTGATVPALDNVSLSCHYYEFYTQNPITDAQVSYSVSNLNGQLAPLDSGNYGVTLNLNDFSLVPGTYSFSVQALKDGYRPLTQVVPLVVIARPVNIQLAQSQTTAYPGDKVQFSLEITDNLTDTYLQRPVNVQLSIQLAGQETGASQTPAASYIFTGVTNTGQWTWTVPGEIAIGQYDVTVTVSSPFFAGTQVFSRALTIVTPQIIWPYLIGLAIAALVGASIYVKREKVISRRSVKGIMILSPQGSSIAQKISPDFSRQNSLLISGAISGVITLMREITGKGLRRIKVEGGYIELVQKTGFWVVLLMHHNPAWVGGTISNLAKDVEAQYGAAIAEWNGQELNLPILELVKKWFGVEILEERSLGLPTGQNNT